MSTTFEHELRCRIIQRLEQGETTFAELVHNCDGAEPVFVDSLISALPPSLVSRVLWREVSSTVEQPDPRLPIPHPLDFDWRFSSATAASVASELLQRSSTGVALLGAPSLWLRLAAVEGADRTWLFDVDEGLLSLPGSNAHVLIRDLERDAVPALGVSAVFADPPWYPDATFAFLAAARTLTARSARVYLSMPPIGTRPGIAEERDRLLAWCPRVGLELREVRRGTLVYAMPPFERNALRAARLLHFVPHDWRSGDLFVFECRGEMVLPPPAHERQTTQAWAERALNGVRIRFRIDESRRNGDPRLIPLLEGDILPTVSRRDPRRALARVWTSGNRIFDCGDTAALLRGVDDTNDPGGEAIPLEMLRDLVTLEREEYILK
jgi:hypothetical protein